MVDSQITSEAKLRPLLERAARRSGVDIEYREKGVVVVHADKRHETAPQFHEPTWAAWWAFRVLHPERLADMDDELRDLFDEYKKGKKKWATYNEAKRRLLAKYLRKRHTP